MPYLLEKKAANPVPLMIKKIHEIQENIYLDAKKEISDQIEHEITKIETKYM